MGNDRFQPWIVTDQGRRGDSQGCELRNPPPQRGATRDGPVRNKSVQGGRQGLGDDPRRDRRLPACDQTTTAPEEGGADDEGWERVARCGRIRVLIVVACPGV